MSATQDDLVEEGGDAAGLCWGVWPCRKWTGAIFTGLTFDLIWSRYSWRTSTRDPARRLSTVGWLVPQETTPSRRIADWRSLWRSNSIVTLHSSRACLKQSPGRATTSGHRRQRGASMMPPGKESQGPLAGSEKSGLTSHEPETFENGGQQTL